MANHQEFVPIIPQSTPTAPVKGCVPTGRAVVLKTGDTVPIYEPVGNGGINTKEGWNALCAAMAAKEAPHA